MSTETNKNIKLLPDDVRKQKEVLLHGLELRSDPRWLAKETGEIQQKIDKLNIQLADAVSLHERAKTDKVQLKQELEQDDKNRTLSGLGDFKKLEKTIEQLMKMPGGPEAVAAMMAQLNPQQKEGA